MSPEKQKITNLLKEVDREMKMITKQIMSNEKRQMLIIKILKLMNK